MNMMGLLGTVSAAIHQGRDPLVLWENNEHFLEGSRSQRVVGCSWLSWENERVGLEGERFLFKTSSATAKS